MKVTLQKIIGYLVAIILTIVIMKSCNKEPETKWEKRYIIKDRIIELTRDKDSTQNQVNKKDSVRVKYIVKWRTKIADTIYKPCDSLILICNDIITVDSSEIASLKQVIKIDSNIISNQKSLLQIDSLEIKSLKNSLKKQKRQKTWAITGLVLVGSAAILK